MEQSPLKRSTRATSLQALSPKPGSDLEEDGLTIVADEVSEREKVSRPKAIRMLGEDLEKEIWGFQSPEDEARENQVAILSKQIILMKCYHSLLRG